MNCHGSEVILVEEDLDSKTSVIQKSQEHQTIQIHKGAVAIFYGVAHRKCPRYLTDISERDITLVSVTAPGSLKQQKRM